MVAVVLLLFLSSLVTLRLLSRRMIDSATVAKDTTEMAAATVVAIDLVMINRCKMKLRCVVSVKGDDDEERRKDPKGYVKVIYGFFANQIIVLG